MPIILQHHISSTVEGPVKVKTFKAWHEKSWGIKVDGYCNVSYLTDSPAFLCNIREYREEMQYKRNTNEKKINSLCKLVAVKKTIQS